MAACRFTGNIKFLGMGGDDCDFRVSAAAANAVFVMDMWWAAGDGGGGGVVVVVVVWVIEAVVWTSCSFCGDSMLALLTMPLWPEPLLLQWL